jgi:hypothetical protein
VPERFCELEYDPSLQSAVVPAGALVGRLQVFVPGGVVAVPAWDTETVCPATVADPERAELLFAVAFNVTVPLPEPLDPAATANHDVPVEAVHPQPAVVVTATLNAPPVEATDELRGDTV